MWRIKNIFFLAVFFLCVCLLNADLIAAIHQINCTLCTNTGYPYLCRTPMGGVACASHMGDTICSAEEGCVCCRSIPGKGCERCDVVDDAIEDDIAL
ncbi:unnamed protein product [Phytomonas sp. EM1]|nr:unnamed protein product [Phytomonas sp. EM1]|eukprot:CCW60136.1 unnamed protein product [Phytomonas sp. isolate EM1]